MKDPALNIPRDAGEIILFGGSFDPPHVAHVDLCRTVRQALSPDGWIVVVPAAASPGKGGAVASANERLQMTRLAFNTLPRCRVWSDEIERGGESYTVDTVARLRTLVDDETIVFLLIGTDQALQFHEWKEPRRLLHLVEPAVMCRDQTRDGPDLRRRLELLDTWSHAEISRLARGVVPTPHLDVSSTAIRQLLRDPTANARRLGDLVDENVLKFIRDRKIYR